MKLVLLFVLAVLLEDVLSKTISGKTGSNCPYHAVDDGYPTEYFGAKNGDKFYFLQIHYGYRFTFERYDEKNEKGECLYRYGTERYAYDEFSPCNHSGAAVLYSLGLIPFEYTGEPSKVECPDAGSSDSDNGDCLQYCNDEGTCQTYDSFGRFVQKRAGSRTYTIIWDEEKVSFDFFNKFKDELQPPVVPFACSAAIVNVYAYVLVTTAISLLLFV